MDLGLKQAIGLLIVIFLAALILMLTGSLSANDGSRAKSNHGALWSGAENVLLNASESDNLVTNGNLRRELYRWNGGTIVNDAPAGSKYKTSIQGGPRSPRSKEFIPFNANKKYKLSYDYKDTDANANKKVSSYPAFIIPHDADKKQITHAMDYHGGAKSHLTQPLKSGDTVVHIDNIGSWNTDKNTYNHIAIYGYKNSKGETYPDYTYTRNVIKFHNSDKTDKTEINKTNGTITIPACTGETIPAGTAVSQNTDGATYIYPYIVLTNKDNGWKHIDVDFDATSKDSFYSWSSFLYGDNEQYIKYIRMGTGFSYADDGSSHSSPLIHDLQFTEID